ncbi:MAG: energy-coupling factor transport system permease protein [Clostridiales bacterium]|jgi:energy-coupling factor transport system permease protein|nr:energy-coupling factor transport system permease protein [Clostridiales bacterium]
MTAIAKSDPRSKLLIAFGLSTLALVFNDLLSLTALFFMGILLNMAMKAELLQIAVRIRKFLFLMFGIAVIQSVFSSAGEPILTIAGLTLIRDEGLIKALAYLIRLSTVVVSATILSTSTRRELVQGLVQLKCPYEIAFMVSVAIRFLPELRNELLDSMTALQLRGIDLQVLPIRKKLKIYQYILLPVLTNAILNARELSNAMEMRAFRAFSKRTDYHTLHMHKVDYVLLTVVFGAFTLLSIGRLWV